MNTTKPTALPDGQYNVYPDGGGGYWECYLVRDGRIAYRCDLVIYATLVAAGDGREMQPDEDRARECDVPTLDALARLIPELQGTDFCASYQTD